MFEWGRGTGGNEQVLCGGSLTAQFFDWMWIPALNPPIPEK